MEEHKLAKLNIEISWWHFPENYWSHACAQVDQRGDLGDVGGKCWHVWEGAEKKEVLIYARAIMLNRKIIASRALGTESNIGALITVLHARFTNPSLIISVIGSIAFLVTAIRYQINPWIAFLAFRIIDTWLTILAILTQAVFIICESKSRWAFLYASLWSRVL